MARFMIDTDTLHIEAEGDAESIIRLAHTFTDGLVPTRADPATVDPGDFTIDGVPVTVDTDGDYMADGPADITWLTDITNDVYRWWDWKAASWATEPGPVPVHVLALRSILSAVTIGCAVEGPVAAAREALARA